MKKFIIVCLALALAFSTFSCGGGGGSGSARHPKGENPGEPSIVKLMPSHYIAQTNASISLHAKVLDGNGDPVQGENVTFTNLSEPFGVITSAMRFLGVSKSIGTLSSKVVKTDKYGVATARLRATTEGFATVQAEVNSGKGIVRDKKTVFFSLFDIGVPVLEPTLSLGVKSLVNDTYNETEDLTLFKTENDNQRTVRAIVYDEFGQRVDGGGTVFFSADTFEVSFLPSSFAAINNEGEAFVTMQVDPDFLTDFSRVINIGASADNGAFDMLTLFLTPLEVGEVIANANPSIITTNGTSTILALASLMTGGVVPDGTSVNFSATCDGADIIMQPFAQTTDGVAAAQFIAPTTPGLCEITATVGGVSGMTTVNVVTSTMSVIPATQTISEPEVDDTATYTVLGGIGPYTAVSDNPGIVSVPADPFNGPTFDVTVENVPSSDTTVTITVYDSRPVPVTATATLVLDVDPPVALRVNPLSVSVTGFTNPDTNPADDVTYYIQGGRTPYFMYSNNDAVIMSQGELADNTFTIDPEAVSAATTVTLTIEDSVGATVTTSVTVTPSESFMGVNPATIQVVHETTIPFHILGGLPDYTIFPNVSGVLDVGGNPFVTSAPSFTGTTICPGSVTVQIVDSDGKTTTSSVTVVIDVALGVLPATQTLVDPVGGETVDYIIQGGVGPYTAISSHPTLVSVPVGTFAGPTLTATLDTVPTDDTTVTITVVDACNNSVDVELEITVPEPIPPAALAINPTTRTVSENGTTHQVRTFQITGGTAGYTVISSDASLVFNDDGAGGGTPGDGIQNGTEGGTWAVANDGDSISVTIPSGDIVPADTDVTLTVSDSGASPDVIATITIQDAIPVPLAINPSAPVITENANHQVLIFQITGGTAPYSVNSSNGAIVFNDDGAGGGTAGDGLVNGTEGGTWAVANDGDTFDVTILGGNIVGADSDVILTVTDSGASPPVQATITIQDAI
jgi:hypothetical protein